MINDPMMRFGLSIPILVLFFVSLLFIGLVNTKADGISNESTMVGHGRIGESTSTANEVVWTQPKKTILKSIRLVCTTAAEVASGDVGYKVGTSSGGAQIVAAITDQILDGGTDIPEGAAYDLALLTTTASDAAPGADPRYTKVARKLYLTITHTTAAATDGKGYFNWVIEYAAV